MVFIVNWLTKKNQLRSILVYNYNQHKKIVCGWEVLINTLMFFLFTIRYCKSSLPTDLFTYINKQGLPNSLKFGLRCGRVCTAKSLNSIEYLASEVFGFSHLVKLAEHVFLNLPPLAIYLASVFWLILEQG